MLSILRSALAFTLLLSPVCINADIVETTSIDDKTLVLLDIDDTLIDSSIALGSGPWRRFAEPLLTNTSSSHFKMYDLLTYYFAQNVPVQLVEPETASLIERLQHQKVPIFGFTGRGKTEWYSSTIADIDKLTQHQLASVGIHFECTPSDDFLHFGPQYFCEGILYSSHLKKGELLRNFLMSAQNWPCRVVFVDDNLTHVKSVEAVLKELQIPFYGFWYRRAAKNRENFDPMVGNIEMEALLLHGRLLEDETAAQLVPPNSNPRAYFYQILYQIDFSALDGLLQQKAF